MATWDQFAAWIRGNYKIADDKGDQLTMLFREGDRSQMVVVRKQVLSETSVEFAEITSPVGELNEQQLVGAASAVMVLPVGGIALVGKMAVVRHSVPLATVDEDEFIGPLELVSLVADSIEGAATGKDDY